MLRNSLRPFARQLSTTGSCRVSGDDTTRRQKASRPKPLRCCPARLAISARHGNCTTACKSRRHSESPPRQRRSIFESSLNHRLPPGWDSRLLRNSYGTSPCPLHSFSRTPRQPQGLITGFPPVLLPVLSRPGARTLSFVLGPSRLASRIL